MRTYLHCSKFKEQFVYIRLVYICGFGIVHCLELLAVIVLMIKVSRIIADSSFMQLVGFHRHFFPQNSLRANLIASKF